MTSPGGKGGRCVGLTNSPPSCVDCLVILEPQPRGTLRACSGLYRDYFTFPFVSGFSEHVYDCYFSSAKKCVRNCDVTCLSVFMNNNRFIVGVGQLFAFRHPPLSLFLSFSLRFQHSPMESKAAVSCYLLPSAESCCCYCCKQGNVC